MGDWIARWHWVVAREEVVALAVYDRLEQEAAEIRHGQNVSSASLRFGFASPRLLVALAVSKWGEDCGLLGRLTTGLAGVEGIVCDQSASLVGALELLGGEYAFAWTPKPEVDAMLARAGLEVARAGAVKVRVLDRATAAAVFVPSDRPADTSGPDGPVHVIATPPALEHPEAKIVVGVMSPAHGLVQLGYVGRTNRWSAEAMRLYASRIGGPGNWNVVRDDVAELPDTHLFEDVAWRLERHGPHVVWQSRGQRARWIRDARDVPKPRRAYERRAAGMMARRWGFEVEPVVLRPNDEGWQLGLPDAPVVRRFLAAVDGGPIDGARFGELAHRLGDVIERSDPRLPELASRFAELAHALSRTSYWMVRDGAPSTDLPPDEVGPRPPWDGDSSSIATGIDFWSWAANCARRIADPRRAAAAAFVALDAALAIAPPVWWTPPHPWIEALLHAEIASDSDSDIDPTVHDPIELDEPAARSALGTLVAGIDLVATAPRDAIARFEAAYDQAVAAGAPVLAFRARLRHLTTLVELADRDRFTELATALLRDLPSPLSNVHYSTGGALFEQVLAWTANQLAWHAVERGEHVLALELVDRALIVCDQRFDNTRDTKVRALLGLGRTDEAYRIVREVLARRPDFDVFADLAASDGYRAWLAVAP